MILSLIDLISKKSDHKNLSEEYIIFRSFCELERRFYGYTTEEKQSV